MHAIVPIYFYHYPTYIFQLIYKIQLKVVKNISTYFKPTNDIVFQLLFGKNKNKDLTDNFIKSILKHEKENINLNNIKIKSEFSLEKLDLKDKGVRLDIIAEYDNATVCIEMQNKKCSNFYQRARCYATKVGAMQLNSGQDYLELKPLIMINILNYKPNNTYTKDFIEHIITVNKQYREYYVKMGIKFIFIFLDQIKNIDIFNPENEFIHWLKFIKFDNREVIEMINTMNKHTKLATDELDRINADEEEKNIARILEFDELDKRLEYSAGVDAGRIEGRAEGKAEGRIEGKLEALLDLAKQMLEKKYKISEIKELTGLSEKEILSLNPSI